MKHYCHQRLSPRVLKAQRATAAEGFTRPAQEKLLNCIMTPLGIDIQDKHHNLQ